jgi:dTDP-4-dehydrorhamnose reductase
MMRVAIFGATGMLGKALVRRWTGVELAALGSGDADLRQPDQVERVLDKLRPDWIVLSAAYTDVDGCELNPQLAAAVNTQGAVHVAKGVAKLGARLVFLSTDYVFDGKKTAPYETSDQRQPLNVYGKTKADAEVKILSILPECLIVRTSWLFGPGGKCFPDTILKLAASRNEIDVVDDQRGSPTYTSDLANAIAQLVASGAQGIVHCTNSGQCSWYEFAAEILRQAGVTTTLRPTTSERFVRPAERPKSSMLSSASLARFGIAMRPWQDTIPDYLHQRAIADGSR